MYQYDDHYRGVPKDPNNPDPTDCPERIRFGVFYQPSPEFRRYESINLCLHRPNSRWELNVLLERKTLHVICPYGSMDSGGEIRIEYTAWKCENEFSEDVNLPPSNQFEVDISSTPISSLMKFHRRPMTGVDLPANYGDHCRLHMIKYFPECWDVISNVESFRGNYEAMGDCKADIAEVAEYIGAWQTRAFSRKEVVFWLLNHMHVSPKFMEKAEKYLAIL